MLISRRSALIGAGALFLPSRVVAAAPSLFIPRNKLVWPGALRRAAFDPSHPASKGISNGNGASVVCLGQANFASLLNGAPLTLGGTPTFLLHNQIGPSVNFATGQFCQLTGQSTAATSGGTFAAIAQTSGFTSADFLITTASLAGIYFAAAFLNIWTGANEGDMGININAGTGFFVAASIKNSTTFSMVLNIIGGPSVASFWPGKTYSSSGAAGSSLATPSGTVMFGNRIGTTTQNFPGSIAVAMYSPAFLPLKVLQAWAVDPWAFWYPPSQLERVVSASAAAAQAGGGSTGSFGGREGGFGH